VSLIIKEYGGAFGGRVVPIVGVALASMQLRLSNSCRVNYYKEWGVGGGG